MSFCLVDVCNALELTSNKISQRLDDGVLGKYPITDSIGRQVDANFINEDSLYDYNS
jgi:prophage antirepressor-like protein